MELTPEEWKARLGKVPQTEAEWEQFCEDHPCGSIVSGVVRSVHPFGFFLDMGYGSKIIGVVGYVKEIGERVQVDDYPAAGTPIAEAVILFFVPWPRAQAYLSIRPSGIAKARGSASS